jgi:hypothetical protein
LACHPKVFDFDDPVGQAASGIIWIMGRVIAFVVITALLLIAWFALLHRYGG